MKIFVQICIRKISEPIYLLFGYTLTFLKVQFNIKGYQTLTAFLFFTLSSPEIAIHKKESLWQKH